MTTPGFDRAGSSRIRLDARQEKPCGASIAAGLVGSSLTDRLPTRDIEVSTWGRGVPQVQGHEGHSDGRAGEGRVSLIPCAPLRNAQTHIQTKVIA
jgi:hypothetical protein